MSLVFSSEEIAKKVAEDNNNMNIKPMLKVFVEMIQRSGFWIIQAERG